MYTASFIYNDEFYLLCSEAGEVVVWETEKQLRKSFIKMYRNISRTKGEGMAFSHYMYFNFMYHYVYDMDVLEKDVTTATHDIKACNSILGTCVGIKCVGEKASEWRKSGTLLGLTFATSARKH